MAFVLIGFMGAGKSSAARELGRAAWMSRSSTATPCWRSAWAIRSPDEFELHGEQAFRAAEEQLVCELLEDRARPADAVIALGGGSVLSARVRAALAGHVTVLLDVEPDAAWERVRAAPNGSERPLARDRDAFVALHAQRRAIYDDLADALLPQLRRGGIAGQPVPCARWPPRRPVRACCGRALHRANIRCSSGAACWAAPRPWSSAESGPSTGHARVCSA